MMTNDVSGGYGNINSLQISKFESVIGACLPSDYRQFLQKVNGGRPANTRCRLAEWPGELFDVHVLWGIHNGKTSSLEWWWKELRSTLPSDMIAIGVDLGGNFIVLKIGGEDIGSIWYWDPSPDFENEMNGKTLYRVADSFTEFLSILLPV